MFFFVATELVDEDQPADRESFLTETHDAATDTHDAATETPKAETETHDAATETPKAEAKMEPAEASEEVVVESKEEEEVVEEEEEARSSVAQAASRHLADGGLLCLADALSSSASMEQLGLCTAEQLVRLHDALGGVMRSVVLELQSRLGHMDGTRR